MSAQDMYRSKPEKCGYKVIQLYFVKSLKKGMSNVRLVLGFRRKDENGTMAYENYAQHDLTSLKPTGYRLKAEMFGEGLTCRLKRTFY